jgi:hypothetical protein
MLLLAPQVAEARYGIHFSESCDYSFHYIKGIRDLFSGVLICALALMRERRAVGVTLLAGTITPLADMLIVLKKSYNGIQQAVPHISAIIVCAVFGVILLAIKPTKTSSDQRLTS